MKTKLYHVDAFARKLFSGNPAGVCPLEQWLPDAVMQNIAMENNLAETAFFVPVENGYHIRWFTPWVEVDLCGHATLAASHVIFAHLKYPDKEIRFRSRSGELRVRREANMLILNFPTDELYPVTLPGIIAEALGISPVEAYKGKTDYLLVYDTQEQVEKITPDFNMLLKGDARGIIVTAPGKESDFVSRFFGPNVGINEDPVTGSAHTSLIPYWSGRLRKTELSAIQLSARRGYLACKYLNDRVEIGGEAVTYLTGDIEI
jgi:PhzF family phenazine biosynthesis protein